MTRTVDRRGPLPLIHLHIDDRERLDELHLRARLSVPHAAANGQRGAVAAATAPATSEAHNDGTTTSQNTAPSSDGPRHPTMRGTADAPSTTADRQLRPRAENPRALGTNPRAQGTNPRARQATAKSWLAARDLEGTA
jgi:hypothetical protein